MSVAQIAVQASEATPSGLRSAPAVHERILRRALGAVGPAATLECIASELWPYLSQRRAWFAQVDAARKEAVVQAVWPDEQARRALPEALPLGPGPLTDDAAEEGMWAGRAYSGEPYDCAPGAPGVGAHITVAARGPGPPRLVTFAAPEAGGFSAGQVACARELRAAVAVAAGLGDEAPDTPNGHTWAGLDPVEIVDYVCAAAAHDVRNILAGIIGALELQQEATGGGGDEVFEAVRRRVLEGVVMMDAMGMRLQRLAAASPRPVDLGYLGAQVAELVRSVVVSAEGAAAPLIDCPDAPAPTLADPREVRRAISALLFNAVHAAGPGGAVLVDTRLERRWALIEVTDDGPGMTEDVRRRAKEPFFTTRLGEHLGLGLTIAEGVARRFGGSLALRSAPGGGTSAVLRLPAAGTEQAPHRPPFQTGGYTQ